MTDERRRVIRAVIELSKVTEENGSTPGEVENAARAAARKIDRYGLTLQEVEAEAQIVYLENDGHARRMAAVRAAAEAEAARRQAAPAPSPGFTIWVTFGNGSATATTFPTQPYSW